MTERVDKDSMECNKPRRTPGHPEKSHIVKACYDGQEKIIRFGEQGASTAGKPKAGESERMTQKRASFKARHAKNIAKGKSSAAYWADRVKWASGGPVELREMYAKYAEGGAVKKDDDLRGLVNSMRKMFSLDTPKDMTAGETVADIAAGFVPGLGTAQAARDFERARREGDRLGMGLAGVGMVPVAGGMVKPGKVAAKSLGELVDQYVRKVRKMDELGPATLSVHRVEAPASAEVPGWHITQDLPGILETGAMTNKAVGDKNMQGWVPAHVGGAYFYSDPRLARAKWEDVAEMLGGDRALAAEMPIIRAQLRRGNRLVPDEDVGLKVPWQQSYQEGSFATTRPVLINQIDRIYSADPGITKDMIRDTVVRQRRYAEGGAVEASTYDPARVDDIVNQIREGIYG